MSHESRPLARAIAAGVACLNFAAHGAPLLASPDRQGASSDPPAHARPRDPVVARVFEHLADAPRPIVLVVDSSHFPPAVWRRVKHLVAFRLHRKGDGDTTTVDAATYLVRDSDLYFKAAAALRNWTTIDEYVWCLLAAVLTHEAAHTAPRTERQALAAEVEQLRQCLFAGHLHASDGWNGLAYLQQVEAKLRNPREHY